MAKINRKYIDKHWTVFIIRGSLAGLFGLLALFGGMADMGSVVATLSVFLLIMGIIDSSSALYNSSKKHGWANSIIDASVDIVAAVALLFLAQNNIVNSVIILSLYTLVSGLIDILHGFISTVDPTDRFIRILAGACGCIIGAVILNAGVFEITTFIRFFGTYMLIVGITSLIYGVHNRSQKMEDKIARSQSAKKISAKKRTSKK